MCGVAVWNVNRNQCRCAGGGVLRRGTFCACGGHRYTDSVADQNTGSDRNQSTDGHTGTNQGAADPASDQNADTAADGNSYARACANCNGYAYACANCNGDTDTDPGTGGNSYTNCTNYAYANGNSYAKADCNANSYTGSGSRKTKTCRPGRKCRRRASAGSTDGGRPF